ncbi:MAG: DUF3108 domain-containing protein [Gammaproteobacteria bacterium]
MNFSTLRLSLLFCLAATCATAAADNHPQPFTVRYDVQYSGARVAETTFTLRPTPDSDMYELRSITEPRGLAALIRYGDVVEESHFRLLDDHVRPVDYRFNDGTRKGKRNGSIFFDWVDATAQSTYKGSDATHALMGGETDRLLLQWQLARDLKNESLNSAYRLIERNEIKEYKVTVLGEEVLITEAGQLRAIKLRRQRTGSSRATLIWAAVEHGYLPVKMVQLIDERPNVVLQVTELKLESKNAADEVVDPVLESTDP